MSSVSGDNPYRPHARCVLWHPSRAEVPADLRLALSQRGVWFVECDTASWATAELCRLYQHDAHTPLILLLMEPGRLRSVSDVLEVAERYAPQATHWVYDAEREPKLRAMASTNIMASASHRDPMDEDGLKISEEVVAEAEESDNAEQNCEGGETQPSILTSRELASLKHPDQAGNSEA